MNELSLFSGAGGGLLGTKLLGWRSVGYVENNTYCQKILAQRIEDGFLDEAPIFGDIRQFIKSGAVKKYQGFVEVVTAGFPCQPFSVAGKKKGKDDERNLWPETLAVIRAVRPRYALLENVPGLLNSGYFPEILGSLAESGFDARWTVLGADDVGAPHRRKRLWILADSNSPREQQPTRDNEESRGWSGDSGEDVADSMCGAREQYGYDGGVGGESELGADGKSRFGPWPTEPDVGRVAHGLAHRMDRLRAIGNGQVPRVVATAWEILTDESNR